MAKNMALISKEGIVENILWCSDAQAETDTLIDINDLPVGIDDSYIDGKFYRDDKEIKSPFSELQDAAIELEKENQILVETAAALVEEIYQSDLTILE